MDVGVQRLQNTACRAPKQAPFHAKGGCRAGGKEREKERMGRQNRNKVGGQEGENTHEQMSTQEWGSHGEGGGSNDEHSYSVIDLVKYEQRRGK